jgi:hypothetical protein
MLAATLACAAATKSISRCSQLKTILSCRMIAIAAVPCAVATWHSDWLVLLLATELVLTSPALVLAAACWQLLC